MRQYLFFVLTLGIFLMPSVLSSCNAGSATGSGNPETVTITAKTMLNSNGCPPNCAVQYLTVPITNQDTLYFAVSRISAEEYHRLSGLATKGSPVESGH